MISQRELNALVRILKLEAKDLEDCGIDEWEDLDDCLNALINNIKYEAKSIGR